MAPGLGAKNVTADTDSDFTPVLRFAVASDVHMKADTSCAEYSRLQQLFDDAYAYADSQSDYSAMDAFVFVGDSADNGTEQMWSNFMSVVNEKLRPESKFLISYAASHDCWSGGSLERCEKMTGVAPNVSQTINGFTFINISQQPVVDKVCMGYAWAQTWLAKQLYKANKADSSKPIFVFQHVHIFNTVYGSLGWGTPEITPTLMNYPQIIDFSGHSHFPINDPRSIEQKYFTSVGTGTLSYFELEKGMTYGTVPPDGHDTGAQFSIVEVDANNRVRIMPYDLISHKFYEDPSSYSSKQEIYCIDKPSDRSSYLYTDARYDNADAPVFTADAAINATDVTSSSATLTFTQAQDGECLNNYSITAQEKGSCNKKEYKIWSEFYVDPTPQTITYTLDGLEAGKTYDITVTAYDTYAVKSTNTLKTTITLAQG